VVEALLIPSEPIRALSGVNVPGFAMAGVQLTLYGRLWATPEAFSFAQVDRHITSAARTNNSRLVGLDRFRLGLAGTLTG